MLQGFFSHVLAPIFGLLGFYVTEQHKVAHIEWKASLNFFFSIAPDSQLQLHLNFN